MVEAAFSASFFFSFSISVFFAVSFSFSESFINFLSVSILSATCPSIDFSISASTGCTTL
jgi:hypothetical protein